MTFVARGVIAFHVLPTSKKIHFGSDSAGTFRSVIPTFKECQQQHSVLDAFVVATH